MPRRSLSFSSFLVSSFAAVVAAFAFSSFAAGQEESWVRLSRADNGAPARLETGVASFAGSFADKEGVEREVEVDLIGAVHIADPQYYDAINELFTHYDTVVFELVADGDVKLPSKEERARELEEKKNKPKEISLNPLGFVSFTQVAGAAALGLQYQLDGIDYGASNLRRGDCSSVELIVQTIKNGDILEFLWSNIGANIMQGEAGKTDASAAAFLFSRNRRLTARRILAQQLAEEEESEEASASENDKPSHESAIIHFRNDKALAAVSDELIKGRSRIAVFFGAAHLPDMAEKLEKKFGLRRKGEIRWLTAWDLTGEEQKSENQSKDAE